MCFELFLWPFYKKNHKIIRNYIKFFLGVKNIKRCRFKDSVNIIDFKRCRFLTTKKRDIYHVFLGVVYGNLHYKNS